jgi:SAM-dependent methyltransferase
VSTDAHAGLAPSAWIVRWSHLVAPNARVLDVACGSGRHVRWFAARGARVTGVDLDAAALAPLRAIADVRVADLEGAPWPLPGERFDAVLCTNYLWRPLLPVLRDSVAPGGVLLYETFAVGNEAFGRPSNPDFLLRSGELLAAFAGLRTVAYEEGCLDGPPRVVQRLVAVHEAAGAATPPRSLHGGRATGGG